MTVTIMKHNTKKYHITLEIKENCFHVQACPFIGDHLCGYPVAEYTYSINEKEKAVRTFKRYSKKYTED